MKNTIFCLTMMITACGPMAEEDVAETTDGLNGLTTFVDCTTTERVRLRRAMTHVATQLAPGGLFSACIQGAILTWTNNETPDAVERAMRENMPTQIRCVANDYCTDQGGGVACAALGIETEEIAVERGYIAGTALLPLAATIAHEIAHNKGWTHPWAAGKTDSPAYPFTVPSQVGNCISSLFGDVGEPNGLNRSSLPHETELPAVGGGGGLPFELSCGSCDVARGFRVESSSANVNKIAMHCDSATTPSTGTTNDSTATSDVLCPGDDVVVGLWSGSGNTINGLTALCARRADVRAGSTSWSQWPFLGGTLSSNEVIIRTCPPTMAVKRIYGRSGARIDQIRIVCESLDAPPQGVPHALARVGTAVGVTQRNQCLGNGAMMSLWGGYSSEIESLGAQCTPTRPGSNGDVVTTIQNDFDALHILHGIGGTGGTPFLDYCPGWDDGDAMIGVIVRSGAHIDSVQGICANATEWSGPSAGVTRRYMRRRGGTGGDVRSLECPRGEFIVGMQTWSSRNAQLGRSTVFGLQPICRRIDYPRPDLPIQVCDGGVFDPGASTVGGAGVLPVAP